MARALPQNDIQLPCIMEGEGKGGKEGERGEEGGRGTNHWASQRSKGEEGELGEIKGDGGKNELSGALVEIREG